MQFRGVPASAGIVIGRVFKYVPTALTYDTYRTEEAPAIERVTALLWRALWACRLWCRRYWPLQNGVSLYGGRDVGHTASLVETALACGTNGAVKALVSAFLEKGVIQ